MILQILWLVVAVLVAGAVLVLALPPLRRAVLSRAIFKTYKSILPQMSDTERDALEEAFAAPVPSLIEIRARKECC